MRCIALAFALLLSACSILPAPDDPKDAPLQQRADRIGAEVGRIRDLPLLTPVPAGERTKDELLVALKQELDKDWVENHRDLGERALKAFGLLPADFDLRAFTAQFLRDQVAGYYDPEKNEFFTVDTGKKDPDGVLELLDAAITVPHELTHAIDNQHFDLLAKQKAAASDDDQATALLALIEGSAMEGGVEHALDRYGVPISSAGPIGRTVVDLAGRPEAGDPANIDVDDLKALDDPEAVEKLRDAPPIISRPLYFPYLSGWRFVNRVRSEFGFAAVDALYSDPPESTEQIYHPERYIDRRDRPQKITLAAPPAGYEAVYQQSLGYLGMRIMLNAFLDDDKKDDDLDGQDAADGWDGDRYVLWAQGNKDSIAWVVAFDHEGDAEDFAEAWSKVLNRRFPAATTHAIARHECVVASGWDLPEGEATAIVERLLAETKVETQEGDHTPDRWYWDVLRFPIAVQVFDRAWQWNALGGHAIHLRSHDGGHQLHLLDGLVLESENNADRNAFWCGLGLVGFHHDRTIDATFWRVPFLHNGHVRGAGDQYRSQYGLAIDSLLYSNRNGKRHIGVLWDLLFDINWGELGADDRHFRFLRIPIG